MSVTFYWSKEKTPSEISKLLSALSPEYPLREGRGDIELRFKKSDKKGLLKVSKIAGAVDIEYASLCGAARGVGLALSDVTADEYLVFETLGIMLDCSRNAVMKIEHLKKWLRRLALSGYNMAMLYTEDTYQLPGEAYFGYMRGAYTLAEMRELDAFAAELGIEMIPCIQTLGHLEKVLRWHAYNGVRDTSSVLLVDKDETYALIDKMISFWKQAFRSRRIHIGMDETHDLGRGRFMDTRSYERGFDIFNRHLAKVSAMCEKHGLKPMIWSDMYFRMGNSTYEYYRKDTVIPDDVKKAIPKDAELVYWDYYHRDYEFYADWIQRHRALDHEPLMGSGAWTWSRWWYDQEMTESTVRPCVKACRDLGVKEFFSTLWGDDGAYCEFDSVLAGLVWTADLAYGGEGDAQKLEKIFKGVCKSSYKKTVAVSKIEFEKGGFRTGSHALLWDDPLMAKWIHAAETVVPGSTADFKKDLDAVLSELKDCKKDSACASLTHGYTLAETMLAKLKFHEALVKAYKSKNKAALEDIAKKQAPALSRQFKKLASSFRKQWMRRNKPFGLETIQQRLAGQVARIDETALRVKELLKGEIRSIPELDAAHETDKSKVTLVSNYTLTSPC